MTENKYPGGYVLPKKNVLVLSCIDLRFTENLLHFLHHDNLENRYDIFALAGASLCGCVGESGKNKYDYKDGLPENLKMKEWKETFFVHLQLAIDLHDIKDVYIVEHEDCGAYKAILKKEFSTGTTEEVERHKYFAKVLAEKINNLPLKRNIPYYDIDSGEEKSLVSKHKPLNVHSFLIDLRGNVKLLDTTAPAKQSLKA